MADKSRKIARYVSLSVSFRLLACDLWKIEIGGERVEQNWTTIGMQCMCPLWTDYIDYGDFSRTKQPKRWHQITCGHPVCGVSPIYDVCTTCPTIYLKGRRHPRSPHLSSMHIQQVPIRSTHIAYALPVRIGASKIGPPSTHKDISRNSRSTSESALGHARARSAAIVNHHIPDWFSDVQSMGVPRA